MTHQKGVIVCTIFSVVLLPLCVLGHPTVSRRPECSPGMLETCTSGLHELMRDEDLVLAATREHLNSACSVVGSVLQCADNFVRNCFQTSFQETYFRMTREQRQAFTELCSPGETQDAYLSYARCFRNISQDESLCGAQYTRIQTATRKLLSGEMDAVNYLPLSCCAQYEYTQCFLNSISHCGNDAEELARPYLKLLVLSQQEHVCTVYTQEYSICSRLLRQNSEEPQEEGQQE